MCWIGYGDRKRLKFLGLNTNGGRSGRGGRNPDHRHESRLGPGHLGARRLPHVVSRRCGEVSDGFKECRPSVSARNLSTAGESVWAKATCLGKSPDLRFGRAASETRPAEPHAPARLTCNRPVMELPSLLKGTPPFGHASTIPFAGRASARHRSDPRQALGNAGLG